MRSRTSPPGAVARVMVVLGCIPFAWGQTAPSFRSGARLQLKDVDAGSPETLPAAGIQGELFSGVPAWGSQALRTPLPPRRAQPLPGTAHTIPGSDVPLRQIAPTAPASPPRPPETPIALQRHPNRNLTAQSRGTTFTFRTPDAAKVLAQLSIGVQADIWHTDNFANTVRSLATEEAIMEWRPIMQFRIGNPPAGDAPGTDYYLELHYTPTQHTLPGRGTSRMLQRLNGEIGRSTPALTTAVRFEYDENIFGASGGSTVEESSTATEVAPIIEYHLSAKTALRAGAAWRRIESQDAGTNRSEYILETGIAIACTPKTTLGMGLEFGHIPFDQARYGAQNYQQTFATMAWQASPKMRVQTRAGIELREFDTPAPKPSRASPVASVAFNWTPSEKTQINAGFLVRNQPSVSQRGATFQEIRFGADGRQRVGRNFYLRGEAAMLQRNYDTGTKELETVVRPAVGFRADTGSRFDGLNVEIYYQFRRVDSNQPASDRDRNLFGIESTLLF